MNETKIIYYVDDDEIPNLIKLNIPSSRVTLKDFRNALNIVNRSHSQQLSYKFFFQAILDDFGVVKKELVDDESPLPIVNGRVYSWLVTVDESVSVTNLTSRSEETTMNSINTTESIDYDDEGIVGSEEVDDGDYYVDADYREYFKSNKRLSIDNFQMRTNRRLLASMKQHQATKFNSYGNLNAFDEYRPRMIGAHCGNSISDMTSSAETTSQSVESSSEYETANYNDQDGDGNGDGSDETEEEYIDELDFQYEQSSLTTEESMRVEQIRNKCRMRQKQHNLSNLRSNNSFYSSVCSLNNSTLSLNILTVHLNMDGSNFLGISIVGQSNKGGNGGIYVGSILSGGLVAQCGKVSPGDMILQVNETSFQHLSNDEAVRVLRDAVSKPGPVKLVIAKGWDLNPEDYFPTSVQKQQQQRKDSIRPVSILAWTAHSKAQNKAAFMTDDTKLSDSYNQTNGATITTLDPMGFTTYETFAKLTNDDQTMTTTINNGNGEQMVTTATYETTALNSQLELTVKSDMEEVVREMFSPHSGLEIKDRKWLKMIIPNAVVGADMVNWLLYHVEGFVDRRDAKKYASNLAKRQLIRHALNGNNCKFSEQCYYVYYFAKLLCQSNNVSLPSTSLCNSSNKPTPAKKSSKLSTLNEENETDIDSVSIFENDAALSAPALAYFVPEVSNNKREDKEHEPETRMLNRAINRSSFKMSKQSTITKTSPSQSRTKNSIFSLLHMFMSSRL